MEKYRCMFAEPNPAYNSDRPFDHIPPQTTVVYFVLIHHLTEVWTCVKMDHEEYQNQVVPQLFCYNYYRKKSQGPGEGKLTLLPQVKDQAIFAAQQWENAYEKEHTALSAVHLAIKVRCLERRDVSHSSLLGAAGQHRRHLQDVRAARADCARGLAVQHAVAVDALFQSKGAEWSIRYLLLTHSLSFSGLWT